ncbi:MAG: deoxynucleoside kinase [Caldilineales bacterium]|nr:deoxynucleoside kinase [Caldilineales bacterium]
MSNGLVTGRDKRFMAVAGNVGVGKSTLTGMLAQQLGWEPFFEAVDDNPYLSDFYQDMRAWSFHSQVFFLSRRLRHHHDLLIRPNSVIQDRSVYEDAEVFARNLFEQGSMSERDYQSYRELYQILCALLPPPDLVVYLRAEVPTLLQRIKARGREYEQGIDPGYLARLNCYYDAWMEGFNLCPVLTIQADNLDFVHHPEHLDRIRRAVEARLAGKEVIVL